MAHNSSSEKTVYLVHCIDTEGPLYESMDETFRRLKMILGVDVEPSRENLIKIQKKQLDLGAMTNPAADIMSPERLSYLDTWDKINVMLNEIMSAPYRKKFADSEGNGWAFSWFVVDHIGYDINPRRRDIGYHNIFDHYQWMIKETKTQHDEINWHFHPMSTYKEAHMCATSFLRSPHLLETFVRRVIERTWFPSCFRAGFHTERPDSHWFLEQWIPFDFSNQGLPEEKFSQLQQDVGSGRFGDWRRAPNDWSHYHPSHDDYQTPGNCRRTIFRCMNIGSRVRNLTMAEVEKAFARAATGKPTVLSFTDHDYRLMQPDVEQVYKMVTEVAKKYPDVKWINSGAKAAAKKILQMENKMPLDLDVKFEKHKDSIRMVVRANKDTFGPQPFLAVETADYRYLTDNFDVQVPLREWSYTFDMNSIRAESLLRVGVASNCREGTACVAVYRPNGERVSKAQY